MEPIEFDLMDEAEADMWWYHGLHSRFLWGVKKFCSGDIPLVLDAGCGTGGFLSRLRDRCACRRLGLEYFLPACFAARKKTDTEIINGTVNQMPLAANSVDAIVFGDILCQDSVDVAATLSEAYRCLNENGIVLINVPAYKWMRSRHDVLVHAARRYTVDHMVEEVEKRGFKVVYRTYWNTLLFPLMVLRRKVFSGPQSGSDVFVYPRLINSFFRLVLEAENVLFNLGLRFPYGGSVFVVGRKVSQ